MEQTGQRSSPTGHPRNERLHVTYESRRSGIKHVTLTEPEIKERGSEGAVLEYLRGK